jgi:hypothetical protein
MILLSSFFLKKKEKIWALTSRLHLLEKLQKYKMKAQNNIAEVQWNMSLWLQQP